MYASTGFVLCIALCITCRKDRSPVPGGFSEFDSIDVIVVGGGLAGLSAAYELRGKKVVLIEKENRLGGRVFTKHRAGISYELGAMFAYDPRWLPPSYRPSPLIRELKSLGVSLAGQVTLGKTVDEVLEKLKSNRSKSEDGASKKPRAHPDLVAKAANDATKQAFFRVIHPGKMNDYIRERRHDWRISYQTHHYSKGNGELIAALEQAAAVEIVLNARVVAVQSQSNRVRVDYESEKKRKSLHARAVIVATPANVAVHLLEDAATSPIKVIRYGPGAVVVVCVRREKLIDFSYIVSPDSKLDTVFSTLHGNRRILTVYYAGEKAEAIAELNSEERVSQTLNHLNELGIGPLTSADILFSDSHHWQELGTIINPESYRQWTSDFQQPGSGIFLAGDYTFWNDRKMPYGMAAAYDSGKIAALATKEFLASTEKHR